MLWNQMPEPVSVHINQHYVLHHSSFDHRVGIYDIA